MKLRMSHLAACLLSLLLVRGFAHDVRPLPAANDELVGHFRLALDAVFGIGIRLQAFLQEKEKNFLVSPISAAVIIGELILGAEGDFRKELVELLSLPNSHLYENDKIHHYHKDKNRTYDLPYSTLHIQLSNLLKALENSDRKNFVLKETSALFVNNRVSLKDEYINNWASKNTNGLINTILAQPPRADTASIFANAIYFLAEWEVPFSNILNRRGPFEVNPTKQVEVTYMVGLLEQILYAETDSYRIIALPYKNEELGMYIILPKPDNANKYDLKTFVQVLKYSDVLGSVSKARRRDVVVKIPKMSVSSSFSILEQLKKYRVYRRQNIQPNSTAGNALDKLEEKVDAFSNFTTDDQRDIFLTNAAVQRGLRIDDIVQQVVVTVNEKGTEAAAVSASTIDYMGGSKNFVVDRPFVFFIRHEATSATLFWGAISNPAD
ncbi:Serpin domain containing protein [Asbolus verrucosus]|uniref:Serpin domain containing protein n=1 Tax=Asbolus verrucosus TaxID=1661398 RepID=A0A482VBE9_ASBVE|nr:Serpin domain containing protein [Asbolus verrucosus]